MMVGCPECATSTRGDCGKHGSVSISTYYSPAPPQHDDDSVAALRVELQQAREEARIQTEWANIERRRAGRIELERDALQLWINRVTDNTHAIEAMRVKLGEAEARAEQAEGCTGKCACEIFSRHTAFVAMCAAKDALAALDAEAAQAKQASTQVTADALFVADENRELRALLIRTGEALKGSWIALSPKDIDALVADIAALASK